jgi:hypothetical protein
MGSKSPFFYLLCDIGQVSPSTVQFPLLYNEDNNKMFRMELGTHSDIYNGLFLLLLLSFKEKWKSTFFHASEFGDRD